MKQHALNEVTVLDYDVEMLMWIKDEIFVNALIESHKIYDPGV